MKLKDDIHIWHTTLNASAEEIAMYHDLLNAEEKERAARFISPLHQDRFKIAHGMLRLILAEYVIQAPQDIAFTVNEHDKPYLKDHPDIFFNLSHSENMCVYGLTRIGEIGVDIEVVRQDSKLDVAKRYFSKNELSILHNLKNGKQHQGFYEIWSRKEAILKATGKGITSIPLSSFSVSLESCAFDVSLDNEIWSIIPLPIDKDYASAAACSNKPSQVKVCQFVNHTATVCSIIDTL